MNRFATRQMFGGDRQSFNGCVRSLLFRVLTTAVVSTLALVSHAASFQDMFANRETVTNAAGTLNGSNSLATIEVGEPQTGGKPGGHSVWISWVAPADGVATFETDGSSFDTTLSAYYFGSTNDTTLDKLHEAARNDDSPGIEPASLIQFGALAGHHYEIAVDGFFGATGAIHLTWSFINASAPPPVIVSVPNDQSARQGDSILLSVDMQTSPSIQLKWRLNETDLDETTTNLLIPSLQATNLGRYSLRVTIGSVRFFTTPAELQINSDGDTNALARDKLLDSEDSPFIGDDGHGGTQLAAKAIRPMGASGPIGVVRGYNGSQVFDTTYATADPSEPPHCGIPAGSSYWLLYQPPTNGTITLDTIGSTFDTVLEMYTYDGALTSYADLISLACDNDTFGTNGPARITVPVVKTRQYVVVVDGVNGAKGTAWLNYRLDTNSTPTAPVLLSAPTPQVVATGSPVTIAPSLRGSPPLRFFWQKNQVNLPGSNLPALFIAAASNTDSGNYAVTVTNDLGSVSAVLPLRVVVPPRCELLLSPTGLNLAWQTIAGQQYTIEQAPAVTGPWTAWTNLFPGDGQATVVNVAPAGARFYRLRVQ